MPDCKTMPYSLFARNERATLGDCNMIKLMKHYATNGAIKARVWYSHGTLIDGRDCVTLYSKDYMGHLGRIFAGDPNYQNDTDISTDYFDKGHVRIFPDSPLWADALARATKGA